jgi:hypothetical protein
VNAAFVSSGRAAAADPLYLVVLHLAGARTVMREVDDLLAPGDPGRDNRYPAPGARGSHRTAIGLTGDPVPVGSRSGAITHRNDQRRISAHT